MSDYKIALLCNAYSTNSECFTLPMGVLVETIYGNGSMRINLPGTNCMASGSVTPLPMNLLDSLTVHAKMRWEEQMDRWKIKIWRIYNVLDIERETYHFLNQLSLSSFASFCLFSLIHSIATRVIKLAHAKSSIALAPALVETYSRLLVYMEIESLGIKGFISESQKHSLKISAVLRSS